MENLYNSRIRRDYQKIYLNNSEISGVQSCQLSYNDIISPIKHVGMSDIQMYPTSTRNGQVDISLIPITTDMFLPYVTGNSGFNGYILKSQLETGENFSFTSGYITSYTSKCSVNNLPETAISVSILGELGRLSGDAFGINNDFNNIVNYTGAEQYKLATFSTIDLSLDDVVNNRVISYDLNINIARNPIYAIGNERPRAVEINYPIEVTFNCAIDVNNYIANKLGDYPCKTKVNNLTLALRDQNTNEAYLSYSFDNMILIGQNYNTSINGNTTLNLQYKTYLSRPVTGINSNIFTCSNGEFGTGTSTATTADPENPIINITNSCYSGNCFYNSGIVFNRCNGTVISGIGVPAYNLGYVLQYSGINYGYVEFEYFHPCSSNINDCNNCGNSLVSCTPEGGETITSSSILFARLKKFEWNFPYNSYYPMVGAVFAPGATRQDVFVDTCEFTDVNALCGKRWHTYPFYVQSDDCKFNFCIDLLERYPLNCDGTTSSTTPSTTTSTTTTTTTTSTTTTTTTSTTTSTTTTTTTTTTTSTTSSTSSTSSSSSSTTCPPDGVDCLDCNNWMSTSSYECPTYNCTDYPGTCGQNLFCGWLNTATIGGPPWIDEIRAVTACNYQAMIDAMADCCKYFEITLTNDEYSYCECADGKVKIIRVNPP